MNNIWGNEPLFVSSEFNVDRGRGHRRAIVIVGLV
jgi:hypothetical protein